MAGRSKALPWVGTGLSALVAEYGQVAGGRPDLSDAPYSLSAALDVLRRTG
ncbi:hypothetical protein [Streptomyces sp. NPDC057877]|uniref:hypothetical protein n=1 Tax=Streptomyces sp. NPDC057877 TaxID=3346269 RepID=UPI0036C2680F